MKMTLFDYYPLPPGRCVSCDLSFTPVVDTGRTTDWDGVVYVCRECAHQIAGLFDMVPAVEVDALRNRAEVAEAEAHTLTDEVDHLHEELTALTNAYELVEHHQTKRNPKPRAKKAAH